MEKKKDQMQEIRMCIQTYFNLHGTFPTTQVMVDWLGTSYREQIPECLDQVPII